MGSILSSSTRQALHELLELDSAPDADPIQAITAIRSAIASLEADPALLARVRDAVAAGATWETIAEAAGLKPAAAKWRWQGSDAEIAARHEAGRKRGVRPSSVPTDLPGHSVAEAARILGVTPQAIYLQVSRGKLVSKTVHRDGGRTYKRVFLDGQAAEGADEGSGA